MSIHICVVSLADADRRRRQVSAQLDSFGCAYEFFDAMDGVKGAQLFAPISIRKYLINTGRLPTPGEIGCFASHLCLWRKCIADNLPICVLEDDCHLETFFPAALENASQLTGQYGFIRLQTEFRAKKTWVRDAGEFQLVRYTKMAHSTLAYIIAPSVASSFVEHSKTMDCPVDVFIKRFWDHGHSLYGLTPYSARESTLASESSIQDRNRSRKGPFVRIARVATKASWFVRRSLFNRRRARHQRQSQDRP